MLTLKKNLNELKNNFFFGQTSIYSINIRILISSNQGNVALKSDLLLNVILFNGFRTRIACNRFESENSKVHGKI